ncbi:MAG: hypothetical protein V7756_07860 [Halopseudomonas sp.]|uniref:hypothetical protein n=1 Tax=Halopseudomonas sp. TaxID=2901191 RepID=UPI00300118AC
MIKRVLALFAVACLFSTTAAAFNGYVEVTNRTGYDIHYLYVSPAKAGDWEEDVLDQDILSNGQTVRVTVRQAAGSVYDIRAEDEDGDTYTLWNVDIAKHDIVFSEQDMD